eukprot:CAMPEP_0182419036 /NCGR_PEP_ID=MMETSP1167-20130531/3426_1 /TAXON_ID=2988 /ORGANISM="Mallomonas Sp, Strain CCMP3275" /LENGTH=365 /DNA_ID=CAMNT_0024593611 /DNA_START=43 /DNA_END=1140 /DNA_ORIENTATION=+
MIFFAAVFLISLSLFSGVDAFLTPNRLISSEIRPRLSMKLSDDSNLHKNIPLKAFSGHRSPFQGFSAALKHCKSTLLGNRRELLKLATGLVVMAIFRSTPVLAASSSSPSFLTKLLDGVTVSGGRFKGMKAGDTRGDFAALLNAVGTCIIFFGLGTFAWVMHTAREVRWNQAYKKELGRVQEYKENMYFEAVQDILKKLNEPKLRGSTRSNLQKQLKDLDPDGDIQKYLSEGGERPDLSHLINNKPKSKKRSNGTVQDRKPKTKKAKKKSSERETRLSRNSAKKEKTKESKRERESGRGGYSGVFGDLYEALSGVVEEDMRRKVVDNIQSRMNKIEDEVKRNRTLERIKSKLEDSEYWQEYASAL